MSNRLTLPNNSHRGIDVVDNQSFLTTIRALSEKKQALAKTAGANDTIAANELVTSKTFLHDPQGAAVTLTLPSAASLVSDLGPIKQTNQSLQFYVKNSGNAGTIALAPGAGITLSPAGIVLNPDDVALIQVFFSSVTSGAEAATAHILLGAGGGAFGGAQLSLLNTTINTAQLAAEYPETTVLSTSGAGDLQAAIAAASDGDIIEIQTNATYSQITIPASTSLIIRAGYGYQPVVSADQACLLTNGAANVVIIGITFEDCGAGVGAGGDANYQGACVSYATRASIVNNIIFYQCQFSNVNDASSAVMLSYHWDDAGAGDNYDDPPQPDELSHRIGFVDCHAFHANDEAVEGAAFVLRGVSEAVFYRCDIDGDPDNVTETLGIRMQNCPDSIVSHCNIHRIGNGDATCLSIFWETIGTPVAVNPSGIIQYNTCREGTDAIVLGAHVTGAVVYGNRLSDQVGVGIGMTGGGDPSSALVLNNKIYNCDVGVDNVAGSLSLLRNNSAFFCASASYTNAVGASNLTSFIQEEESYGTFELGASGGITATVADGIEFAKQGPVVSIILRSIVEDGAAGGATISLTADGAVLPIPLRPSATVRTPVQIVDADTEAIGLLEVTDAGAMTLYDGVNTAAGTFTGGAGDTGLPSSATITYVAA